jgi:predicted porin
MKLKKLTLAAAVAAAASAPVMAQTSVTIYGKLYPYLLNESGSHASAAGTPVATLAAPATGVSNVTRATAMQSANSRLGFRGTEDLGGGMKANFQLEGVAKLDDGGGPFQFGRNTFVELVGGFGSIKLGNHDTIFKEYGDTIGVLGLSSGSFMSTSDLLRKTGFGTSSSSSFHLRRPNSIIYTTPEWHDVSAGFQFSTDEVVGGPRKPRVASMGVRWDTEQLYVALAHEIHWDIFGGSNNAPAAMRNSAITDRTHSKDQATEFVVEWRPNKTHKIEFDAVRKQYKETATVAGRFASYRNMAYLVNWEARWSSQWRTDAYVVRSQAGSCSRVAALCTTDGLEGTKYTAAAGYSLSKRTMLFAAASLIKNGKSARYSNVELGNGPTPGEDIRQIALGVSHNF